MFGLFRVWSGFVDLGSEGFSVCECLDASYARVVLSLEGFDAP